MPFSFVCPFQSATLLRAEAEVAEEHAAKQAAEYAEQERQRMWTELEQKRASNIAVCATLSVSTITEHGPLHVSVRKQHGQKKR